MPNEFNEPLFRPQGRERDYKNLAEAESLAAARNREAHARMLVALHDNPKLTAGCSHHEADAVLWAWLTGSSARNTAALLRTDRRASSSDREGAIPHLEQPAEFARRVLAFADAARGRRRVQTGGNVFEPQEPTPMQVITSRAALLPDLEQPLRLAAREPAESA